MQYEWTARPRFYQRGNALIHRNNPALLRLLQYLRILINRTGEGDKISAMKIKHLLILILACSAGSACKNYSEQCLAVPMAYQILSANVRIVDKTTGADLFLSPASPYKLSDLTVTSSVTGNNVTLLVDSSQKDKRFVRIIGNETQNFILKLAALPADTVRMNVSVTQGRCYSTSSVSSITLNGKAVCAPCSFSDLVTISK